MVDFTFIIILIIPFLLWLPQAIYQEVRWTYWWQVKEYRPDRFWVFLKSGDGKEKLGIISILLKLTGLILGIINPLIPFIVFVYLDFLLLKDILSRKVRKPVVTKRVEKIWATSLFGIVITSILFFFLGVRMSLVFGELFLVITPYIGILWTIPIVNKVKKEEILKARKVLQRIKPIVIGVTGSYGKTTTKEFVAHLLSQKYKTAKTEGSENTQFGIARKTFKNVKNDTKYFVVEMGAYKIGEIKGLAGIVDPEAGVITGIEEQHLSLFGSLENIKKAKFELIESLPKGGIAVFNLSNKYARELSEEAKKLAKDLEIYGYYMLNGEDVVKNASLHSRVVTTDAEGITFEVTDGKERRRLTAPLHGIHFIENLTGAILVARLYGVSWREIERGVLTLTTPSHTMKLHNLKNGNIIIDDTYNTTPTGFKSAVEYLSLFKNKKKVVVTAGIIELGDKSRKIHMELGKDLSSKIDLLILASHEFFKTFSEAFGEMKNKVIYESDGNKIIKLLGSDQNQRSVILLEGRLPSSLNTLLKN